MKLRFSETMQCHKGLDLVHHIYQSTDCSQPIGGLPGSGRILGPTVYYRVDRRWAEVDRSYLLPLGRKGGGRVCPDLIDIRFVRREG
ncbi:MAG: hypothetical protein ABW185_14875 [Sedimenticola sp.]